MLSVWIEKLEEMLQEVKEVVTQNLLFDHGVDSGDSLQLKSPMAVK